MVERHGGVALCQPKAPHTSLHCNGKTEYGIKLCKTGRGFNDQLVAKFCTSLNILHSTPCYLCSVKRLDCPGRVFNFQLHLPLNARGFLLNGIG